MTSEQQRLARKSFRKFLLSLMLFCALSSTPSAGAPRSRRSYNVGPWPYNIGGGAGLVHYPPPYQPQYPMEPDCCLMDLLCQSECGQGDVGGGSDGGGGDMPWPIYPTQAPPQSELIPCPITVPGWIILRDGNTKVYLGNHDDFGDQSMFSWAKADAKAMEMHSSLIELRTEERSAEVADIVRRCYPIGSKVWLGGHNFVNKNQWTWASGGEINQFTNWKSPDQVKQSRGLCLQMESPDAFWIASECFEKSGSGFIIEKALNPPSNPGPTPPNHGNGNNHLTTTSPVGRPSMYPSSSTAAPIRTTQLLPKTTANQGTAPPPV